ncbi:MAG TPA: TPM domain-containing protein [Sphingomonas sp.]|nr:TPM domain-containing protein [Sphingomonas sp.]
MALVAFLALFLPSAALAQTFPQFTGLVTDAANVLPPDRKAALESKLQALQQQTNHQLVVATIPDLQGYDIADYGYRLGRAWAVGLKGADNGAILIVAPKERKVRVEVGYGLEPIVTDALSSLIIQTRIIPAFKTGDMAGGIEAGADALAQQLSLPDDQAKAKAAAAKDEYDKAHARKRNGGGIPFGAILWLVIIGFVLLSSIGRHHGRRYRRGSGSGSDWPIWLWAASELTRNSGNSSSWGGGSPWGGGGGDSDGGGGWGGGGFTGGGGGSFGGGGASGSW